MCQKMLRVSSGFGDEGHLGTGDRKAIGEVRSIADVPVGVEINYHTDLTR